MKNEFELQTPIKIIRSNYPRKKTSKFIEDLAKVYFLKKGYFVWVSGAGKYTDDSQGLRRNFSKNLGYLEKFVFRQKLKDIQTFKKIYYAIRKDRKQYQFFKKYFLSTHKSLAGIPDLFIFNEDKFFFAEVKSESDGIKLSQTIWIRKARRLGIEVMILFIKNKGYS